MACDILIRGCKANDGGGALSTSSPAARMVMSGRGDELIDLAHTNLWRWARMTPSLSQRRRGLSP